MNVPVSCGDTVVNPGDAIVAENDGVVVGCRCAAEVAEAARARVAKEEATRARYSAGDLGLDINDMRPKLAQKGLTYITQADYEGK